MRFRRGFIVIGLAILVTLTFGIRLGICVSPVIDCTKAAFDGLSLTDEEFCKPVIITSAVIVAATATEPEYCDVHGSMWPSIGFAVKLPTTAWNNRFQMTGCGGAAGSIPESTIVGYIRQGFASAGTNTGHTGSSTDWSFGYNPPDNSNPDAEQKIADYGYRSAHETVVLAKKLIKAYYGVNPSFSYYTGASCGGRLGMMNAQRFPNDFDGLVIAMPPLNMLTRVWDIWNEWAQEGNARIPIAKLNMLADTVYGKCDGIDGLVDGFIDDPRNCNFNPLTELPACPNDVDAPNCFTLAQRAAAQKIYEGPRTSTGEQIFPPLTAGSEIFNASNVSTWVPYISQSGGFNMGIPFIRYIALRPWLSDPPTWDWKTFDYDNDPQKMAWVSPIVDTLNPDLSGLKQRGAKMIHYHGWSDTLVASLQSPMYYEDVLKTMGVHETKEFYKLYMIPGYGHGQGFGCSSSISWDGILRDWVENGIEPGVVIGTRPASAIRGTPVRTRPLCPYPEVARYSGSDSIEVVGNFMCVPPVEVRFEPQTLNLKSKGVFTAFITVPEGYNLKEWEITDLECAGAPVLKGTVSYDGRTYNAKFSRQDLVGIEAGEAVELKVTGFFKNNGKQGQLVGYGNVNTVK